MSPSPMDWAPQVISGGIPQDAPFSDAPVVAYVSLNDAVFNFGHALFDFLFPVFNTLQLLDVYHPDFQLLLAEHQVCISFTLPCPALLTPCCPAPVTALPLLHIGCPLYKCVFWVKAPYALIAL